MQKVVFGQSQMWATLLFLGPSISDSGCEAEPRSDERRLSSTPLLSESSIESEGLERDQFSRILWKFPTLARGTSDRAEILYQLK